MARSVADRWVNGCATGEYRFTIFGLGTPGDVSRFASVLRSWRDGKLKIRQGNVAGSAPIADLGVKEIGDSVEVWSSDIEGLRKLAAWAEERGLDTSFIW